MVKIITSTLDLISQRNNITAKLGFVPTMGNLHRGHISLLEEALKDFDVVVFSIFVNPKQFGPNEDFDKYPRTLMQDIALIKKSLEAFSNKDVWIFAPKSNQEIYPQGYKQVVSVMDFDNLLEGAKRPGHFNGVSTVVYRLFEIIKPSRAYFGLKDYQQFLLIKKMVQDLALPIEIVGMPIVREESGLAMSSRNQYLSASQKEEALILNSSIKKIANIINHKRSNLVEAKKAIQELLQDKNWNYLEMRDSLTLSEDLSHSNNITLLGVYQLGSTRLLDNLQVEIA